MTTFYDDEDLSRDEYRRVRSHWIGITKEMTRAQVVQTMADNRSLDSPVYHACADDLRRRDLIDDKTWMKREELDIWSAMSVKDIRRHGKRHHKPDFWVRKVLKNKAFLKAKSLDKGIVPSDNFSLAKAA